MEPITAAQVSLCQAFYAGKNIVAYGSAGTGKTYLSVGLALERVQHPKSKQKEVIIVRSAVPTRSVGFLPGTLEEKMAPYELPYKSMGIQEKKDKGLIRFLSTSYLRGLTLNRAIIIADEVQNFSWGEIYTLATRLGKDSRIIFTGDISQSDLPKAEGFTRLLQVASAMEEFALVSFGHEDIVRSDFCKNWIIACEEVV